MKLNTDLFEDFSRQDASKLELIDVQVQRSSTTFFESGIEGITAKVKKLMKEDVQNPSDCAYKIEVSDEYDEF